MNKKYIAPSVEIIDIPEEDIIATSDNIEKGTGPGDNEANSKRIDFSSEDEDFGF